MFNLIKQWGIGVVDLVNNVLDPYDDFTRIFLPPDMQFSLKTKADLFAEQYRKEFRTANGLTRYNRANPANNWEVEDVGDQAVHHGLATAALAFGHAAGDVPSDDVFTAAKAIRALFVNGKLIRGVHPAPAPDVPSLFEDDASNDSASGALCGIFFASRYGKPDAGCEGIDNIRSLADELLANNYSLVKQDGSNTTYGKLINGILTDPQRSSLALAILRSAHIMTGDPKYRGPFETLYKKYGALLRFAEFKFLDYTKSHEVHRCAIHLHILAELAHGDAGLAERCAGGLERIWKLNRKTRDPWIAALVNRWWRIPDAEMRDVVHRLHEYPSAGKPPPREAINSAKADYWKDRGVKFLTVNGNVRASQPLPYHMIPTQDFWPQRHPFMCDGFAGANDTFIRHNAVDFLAPYYLLRVQGVIKADE